jgi:pyruvate dehydrogenase E1 component alpha subunit
MYATAAEAVERARAGNGPTFIEAKTFRFLGHLLGDDSHYIPASEMAAAKAADPLPAYRRELVSRGVAESVLTAIDADILAQVEDAAQFALDSPYPDTAEIRIDVLQTGVSS